MHRPVVASILVVLLLGTLAAPAPAEPAGQQEQTERRPGYAATPADAAVRPGAPMGSGAASTIPMVETKAYCTYNWVFHDVVRADPVTGVTPEPAAYIGTAGHCTDEVGEVVSVVGYGRIGTVVFDSDLVGSDADFSLVRLDPRVVADTHPQMRGFAAPTGYVTGEDLAAGDLVGVHGYGMVVGQNDVTRDRVGVLVSHSEEEYVADMPALPGDSGSALVHVETGAALGIISRFGFDQRPPSTDVGPLLPWILRELDAAGFDVELALI